MEDKFKQKTVINPSNSEVQGNGVNSFGEPKKAVVVPDIDSKKPKTKKAKIRKLITTIVFIAFNIIAIIVVLGLELKNESDAFVGASAIGSIISDNLVFFFVAFLMYAIHIACDAVAYFALIKQCGYGNRYGLAIRVAILGKYYDNITPWNTGGQPFQMAYMAKANIDAPTACSLPLIKYAIRVFFFDAVVILLFAVVRVEVSPLVISLAVVGLVATSSLPILLIIFSRNVDFMLKATKWLVGLGVKVKIVKDYDKTLAKAQDQMDSFLAAFKYLGKHKNMIVIIGLVSVIDCICLSAIPYFIIRSFGTADLGFFETLTKTFYVTVSSGLMPTPGASGASEGAFYSVFAASVPAGFLFWAVLFWRLLVFYLPLALGVITLIVDWFLKNSNVALVKKELAWKGNKTIRNGIRIKKGNSLDFIKSEQDSADNMAEAEPKIANEVSAAQVSQYSAASMSETETQIVNQVSAAQVSQNTDNMAETEPQAEPKIANEVSAAQVSQDEHAE